MSAGRKVCGIPASRTGNRQALTDGFNVSAFQFSEVVTEGKDEVTSYTWKPPEGTAIVHCALFGCRPVVGVVRYQEDRPVREIINFDQCVLAHELFEPGSGVFDLSNPELEYQPTIDANASCRKAPTRQISELQIGCWAYDTTDIVGATPLRPIDPRSIYNYHGTFGDCTAADADRKACVVDGTSRIGMCRVRACRDICVSNDDCDQPELRAAFEREHAFKDAAANDGGASAADVSAAGAGADSNVGGSGTGGTSPGGASVGGASAGGLSPGGRGPVYVPPICQKTDPLDYVGYCEKFQ